MKYGGLKIWSAEEMSSCNSCYAKNYDDQEGATNERVEKILNIKAGQTVIHLCGECAKRMIEELNAQIT